MGVDRIFVTHIWRRFDQAAAFAHNIRRLVGHARNNAVTHLDAGHRTAHAAHNPQVAVADPARIVGRTWYAFGTFIVAPVGADL